MSLTRIGLDDQRARGIGQKIEAGAHHLRLAAEGIGILHAVIAGQMRGADLAAGEQAAIMRGRELLAGMRAQCVDARIEGRVGAHDGIDRHGAGKDRGGGIALGGEQAGKRERGRDLRAVEKRQAFLGAQRHGLAAEARERRRATDASRL